jgi:endonuclease VIII
MPEGDTIHRAAASLRAALGHGPLVVLDAPGVRGAAPVRGEAIEAIEARGKHLLVCFAGGSTLHTHLGMTGSWRVDPPSRNGARPTRPGTWARVVTDRAAAVCRSAPTVELLDPDALRRHPVLSALGPDLCLPDPDLGAIVSRLRALLDPATPIGVALLDQRPASGIGNVYRSEVLWACAVDPFAPVSDLDDPTLRELFATANRLLRANLGGWRRRTYGDALAVYDRAGRACPRCGAAVASRKLGEQARTTWWCPTCQTSAP